MPRDPPAQQRPGDVRAELACRALDKFPGGRRGTHAFSVLTDSLNYHRFQLSEGFVRRFPPSFEHLDVFDDLIRLLQNRFVRRGFPLGADFPPPVSSLLDLLSKPRIISEVRMTLGAKRGRIF